MPPSLARLSASESSHRDLFSVVFITNIAESDFWYTQGGIGAAGRPHREISCRACTALYNNSTRVSGPARRKCGCAKTAIIVSYIALCMTQVKAPDLKRLEKYVRIIG